MVQIKDTIKTNWNVITGGPSSGKTTTINLRDDAQGNVIQHRSDHEGYRQRKSQGKCPADLADAPAGEGFDPDHPCRGESECFQRDTV